MKRVFSQLDEAITGMGVIQTFERTIDKARKYIRKLQSSMWVKDTAVDFRNDLERIAVKIDALAREIREDVLAEKSQPKLNKYDPGSLLGWTVYLLDKEGLDDAAAEVRKVSRTVSRAWQERER